jgi:hypothetical protein
MPIERNPANPLPPGYVPSGGRPYKVQTNDDLGSIARANGITEEDLELYNFGTVNFAEINWYLRHHVGCVQATHDRKNWVFTSNANPGVIYLPPAKDWKRPSFPSKTPGELSTLPTLGVSKKRSGIWFGLGGQEGGHMFVIGKDTVEACLYSAESFYDRMWLNIDGWRFGPGLGASIGVAFAVATGVHTQKDLDGFQVSGVDFQGNLGGRWGDIAKFAKELDAVKKIASGAKIIDKTLSVAEWEKTRDIIWNAYKATSINSNVGLNVFGIPGAGVGLELSAYWGFGTVSIQSFTLQSL